MSFRKILLIVLLILVVFCFAMPALADIPVLQPQGTVSAPLPDVIAQIINLALYIVGTVAVLFLIIGGFQFIIAAGNPDGVQTAKSTIIYVIIGLAIIILSNVTVQFIIKKLSS